MKIVFENLRGLFAWIGQNEIFLQRHIINNITNNIITMVDIIISARLLKFYHNKITSITSKIIIWRKVK